MIPCPHCSDLLPVSACLARRWLEEWRLIGAAASVRPLPMPRDLDAEERTRRAVEGGGA